MLSFLSFGRFGHGLQSLQTSGPVVVEKLAESTHLGLIGAVEPASPVTALDHQFGLPQNAEVLGDGRPGDIVEPGRDLGRRKLVTPYLSEDLAPPGLGEGFEGRIHNTNVSIY